MPIPFKYNGNFSFNKDYSYVVSTETSVSLSSINVNYITSDFNVSAYAFGNVDAYGSQVLCWFDGKDISTALYNKINETKTKLNNDKYYSQISSMLIYDINNAITTINTGWTSVNNRSLKPIGA